MGVEDFPISFGFPVFLRIFFPGFILSGLLYCSLVLYFEILPQTSLLETLIIIILLGFIYGLIISGFDFYIYQFYEGYRFWPKKLWVYKYNKVLNKFNNIIKTFEEKSAIYDEKMYELAGCEEKIKIIKSSKKRDKELFELEKRSKKLNDEIQDLYNEISKICHSYAEYPFDAKRSRRRPHRPTRLGNVIAEYETYSDRKYGMDLRFFWYELWCLLPDDTKNFLEFKGALADFFVYLSFIFLIYAPFAGFIFIKPFYDAVIGIYPVVPIPVIIQLGIYFILIIFIFIFFSYIFYQISIKALINYGRFIKAVFDIYRVDLARKLDPNGKIIKIKPIPLSDELKFWRNYGLFLHNYKR